MWAKAQQGKISFNPQNLNFADICKHTVDILKPNANAKNITVVYPATHNLNVFADRYVKNEYSETFFKCDKFTDNGGVINISAKQNDSTITISVSDNGVGMHQKVSGTDIFEVLTTKGTAKETEAGLGLLLCKEFVEKHGR